MTSGRNNRQSSMKDSQQMYSTKNTSQYNKQHDFRMNSLDISRIKENPGELTSLKSLQAVRQLKKSEGSLQILRDISRKSLEVPLLISVIDENENQDLPSLATRIKVICIYSLPNVLSNMIFYSMQLINFAFAGHYLQKEYVAAIGTGNMIQMILVTSFSLGLNNVMDTTISQAAGAGNLKVCGIYLNLCRAI